jgi:hypothetical protein
MDADRVNRWLTLGANIGVLTGIILLVVELDQNREAIRAQTRNDVSRHISDQLSHIGSNEQLTSLMHRAEAGEDLSLIEERQQFLLFTSNKRMWENISYQYRHGMFSEEEYEAEKETWRFLINMDQSFARNWCPMRKNYSPQFVAEIESLINDDICGASISN